MANTMEKAFIDAGFAPLKERKSRAKKVQKCRKCGAPMQYLDNTNVMVCTGEVEVTNDEGKSRFIPCNNRFIFNN